MAVVNEWVSSAVENGRKGNPGQTMPGKVFAFACTFEIAAADSDTSIFKIGVIKSNLIPVEIELCCDALTSSTDWDLGFYKLNGDAADVDVLMDGTNISTGYAIGSEINCLSNLGVEDIGSNVWELLDLTVKTKQDAYILALTANTIGSAAGTISLRGIFVQG